MHKVYFPCGIMMRKVPYMSHGYLHTIRALLQQNKLKTEHSQNAVIFNIFNSYNSTAVFSSTVHR